VIQWPRNHESGDRCARGAALRQQNAFVLFALFAAIESLSVARAKASVARRRKKIFSSRVSSRVFAFSKPLAQSVDEK
jgi:hypothetical protein